VETPSPGGSSEEEETLSDEEEAERLAVTEDFLRAGRERARTVGLEVAHVFDACEAPLNSSEVSGVVQAFLEGFRDNLHIFPALHRSE